MPGDKDFGKGKGGASEDSKSEDLSEKFVDGLKIEITENRARIVAFTENFDKRYIYLRNWEKPSFEASYDDKGGWYLAWPAKLSHGDKGRTLTEAKPKKVSWPEIIEINGMGNARQQCKRNEDGTFSLVQETQSFSVPPIRPELIEKWYKAASENGLISG